MTGSKSITSPTSSTISLASEPRIVWIYALAHPETGEVRYVGKSVNPQNRYRLHLSRANNPKVKEQNQHLARWIRKVVKPALIILDETDELFWKQDECWWIKQFDNLINRSPGGDPGPMDQYPSARINQSLAMKRRRGIKLTDEHKAKLSASHMGLQNNLGKGGWKHTPETIERIKKTASSKWTPEMKEAARQRRLGKPPGNKGRKMINRVYQPREEVSA